MATTYMVNVPLVITRDEEGRHVYLYGGAAVPAGLAAGELDRLKQGEFVIALPDEGPTIDVLNAVIEPAPVVAARKPR